MLKRDKDSYSLVELAQLIATEHYLDVGVVMELQRMLEDEVQAALCCGKKVRIGGYLELKYGVRRLVCRKLDRLDRLQKQLEG